MSATDRFTILIAGLGLVFTVMSAILAVVVKAAMNWGKNTEQLGSVVSDLSELKDDFADKIGEVIKNKEQEHGEIKERLTYLERRELDQRRSHDH
jgi:hypothetical protein